MEYTEILNSLMMDARENTPLTTSNKYEGTPEQWEVIITNQYANEVNKRGHVFVKDEATQNNIRTMAQWLTDKTSKPSLLFIGGVGSGKSTLLKALKNAIDKYVKATPNNYKMNLPLFLNAQNIEQIYNKDLLLCDFENGKLTYKTHFDITFLIIDDLGCEPSMINDYGTKKTPINDLIYKRYEDNKTTVIATNLDGKDLRATYGERVFDRLKEMCQIVVCNNESYRK